MSKLLFRLRHVPDDEADEVRQLLDENEIEFFETSPGNWGISMPGLWVKTEDEFERGRALIDIYQEERRKRVREELELSKARGDARTTWHVFRENPIRFIAYLGLIVGVLYLSLDFFLSL